MPAKQDLDSRKERILDHDLKTWIKDQDELNAETEPGETTRENKYIDTVQEVLTDFNDVEEELRDMDREELILEALSLNVVARDTLATLALLTDRIAAMNGSYCGASVDMHPDVDKHDDVQKEYALYYLVKTARREKDVLDEEKRPRSITEHEKEMVRMGLQDFGVTQGAVSRIIGRSKSTVNKVAKEL